MSNWEEVKRRMDALNLKKGHYKPENKYGFPVIRKQDFEVKKLVQFGNNDFIGTAHFFIDDFKFERVWNKPKKYLNVLKRYGGVLSPDFSLYTDYPIALQIYNTYRSRWCGRYWQDHGINVIPTVEWSTPESYEFCFQGIEEGSTIAISSMGCLRDKNALKLFKQGFNEAIKQLKPEKILFYGTIPNGLDCDIGIQQFTDFRTQRRQQWAAEDQAVE